MDWPILNLSMTKAKMRGVGKEKNRPPFTVKGGKGISLAFLVF
mgnify:CR=1 FL=1